MVRTFSARLLLVSLSLPIALAARADDPPVRSAEHAGPRVAEGDSGPARYVAPLYEAFDTERALAVAAFADRWYRAPGNEGYEASLEHVAARLREAGFGRHPRLELEWLETEMAAPAWNPRRARLELRVEGREPELLLGFEHAADPGRTMLPVNAPAAEVEGPVVFDPAELRAGVVLVTAENVGTELLKRARKAQGAAVLSSALFEFTRDPTGEERHRDAILFRSVPAGTRVPVAQISPRVHERIREACAEHPGARLAFTAEVELQERKLRTLVARVVGGDRAEEAVAIVSHVQEPGAGDNASGVAGTAEAARCLAGLLQAGTLAWPERTTVLIWGDEFRQSMVWLQATHRKPIAGISADMLGQSAAQTGAIALLERNPDPGALVTVPPDVHTPWGASRVARKNVVPNGLAVIARTALHDVARHVGGWTTSENPWEGGSDHDIFLRQGIPAVLFWHFTDFTYHTGLDRLEMLDGEELRRTSVVVLATALALTDARPEDAPRYVASLELERELRVAAAREVEREDVAEHWNQWCDGAAEWLRATCR